LKGEQEKNTHYQSAYQSNTKAYQQKINDLERHV
jgi:hypothetical protein